MSSLLTRDQILSAPDITTEDVEVPEWGGTVRVRGLSASQRDAFESASVAVKGKKIDPNFINIRARLVALAVVDDNGDQMFTNADIKALGEKSAAPIDRIFDVASRLSGVSEGDIDQLEGNSNGQSDGSHSV